MLKKGQFFLIAALIISGFTIGLGTLYNEAKIERADTQVYDFSKQLYSEIQQTYDSGVIRGKSSEQIRPDILRLATFYSQQNPDSNFQVIYGNTTDLNVLEYSQQTGETRVVALVSGGETMPPEQLGGTESSVQQQKLQSTSGREIRTVQVEVPVTKIGREGKVKQETIMREFNVQQGQNFYIVVRKKVRNEEVVITQQSGISSQKK